MKKLYIIILAGCAYTLLSTSCKKVLNKQDLTSASPDLIFGDSVLVKQNVDFIYGQNLPNWYGNTGGSVSSTLNGICDEAYNDNKFMQGTLTNNDVNDIGSSNTSGPYNKIRIINTFLRDLAAGKLTPDTKKRFAAQALFWRAYRYFDLVRLYGGVPLVLTPLDAVGDANKQAALLPRNKTSDCIKQIVADLDSAIRSLPQRWPDSKNDYGRITSQAAAAFKGRVLLTWASPEFNPTNDRARWQQAYDANLQAKNICDAAGNKLMPDYAGLWFVEGYSNTEAIMVTGYNSSTGDQQKDNNGYDLSTRPAYTGTGNPSVSNQPIWEMVQSYPMLDGLAPNASTKYPYSLQSFYKNRDPRFDKTIGFNGCNWPINSNNAFRLWTYYYTDPSSNKIVTTEPITGSATTTGFYLRKAIDPTLAAANVMYSGNDWIEIRYAEVLLNLGECAAEIGNLNQGQEAYSALISLRQRAGVEAGGDGLYGLAPTMNHDQMINAIMLERKIELAYEGKRFWDLRRRNMLQSTLNGTRRSGIRITLNAGAPASLFPPYPGRDQLTADAAYAYFTITPVTLDNKYTLNVQTSVDFFGIPTATISSDPNILQNKGWGGSFDPQQ